MIAANPMVDLAREADRMGRGDEKFRQLAYYCMAIVALGSMIQTADHFWSNRIREERRLERGRGR